MKKESKASKLISEFAKDVVNNNIHGYGSGNPFQNHVDKKINKVNESSSMYTDEERKRYAAQNVFKNHQKAFEKLIDHPKHYGGDNTYEAIKVIEAWKLDFHLGNVLKYICRAGIKSSKTEIEDLEKAKWYLQRKIDLLKKND